MAECAEAKLQVRKFGIPPLMGKNYFFIVIINSIFSKNIFKGSGDNEEERAYLEEVFKETTQLEKKDKITNQFHFIERATQTKNNDTSETMAQTDPPPM